MRKTKMFRKKKVKKTKKNTKGGSSMNVTNLTPHVVITKVLTKEQFMDIINHVKQRVEKVHLNGKFNKFPLRKENIHLEIYKGIQKSGVDKENIEYVFQEVLKYIEYEKQDKAEDIDKIINYLDDEKKKKESPFFQWNLTEYYKALNELIEKGGLIETLKLKMDYLYSELVTRDVITKLVMARY